MRNILREIRVNLETAWWHFIHPEWDEPERDETTPQVIAAYVAKRRHPRTCDGSDDCGCAGGAS